VHLVTAKSPANVPSEAAKDIQEALVTPGKNFGKDKYTIDLAGAEETYWLGTESVRDNKATDWRHCHPLGYFVICLNKKK